MRLLRSGPSDPRSTSRPKRRLYDEAAREALIVPWEAPDRICGKRLKALIPTLAPDHVFGLFALATRPPGRRTRRSHAATIAAGMPRST
jgi:hypothetical protein